MSRHLILLTILALTMFVLGTFMVPSNIFSAKLKEESVSTSVSIPKPSTEVWGIFDPHSGKILVGKNIDTQMPIASVAKLFTAEIVMRSKKKNESFTITDADVFTDGRSGKLRVGQEVTAYRLLFPMLIESSNDAAEAIRRYLGNEFSSGFIEISNDFNLENTILFDASGLDVKDVSTVSDLARTFSGIKRSSPHVLDITQLYTYVGTESGYINNDPARSFPNFTGGKHGYTDEAGRTFVGTFILSDEKTEVGIVLLRSDDLKADINSLLTYQERILQSSVIMTP